MSENIVTYESQENIAIVSLNRPDRLNAINNDMIESLNQIWHRFNESEDRCAIIRGLGAKAFSAGADLKNPPSELWQGIPGIGVAVEKPIIAATHGHCVGGAYVLVQMCDMVIAAESTSFTYPEAQIGFSGGLIAGCAARIPHKIAMEFMLTGKPFDAQRAYEVGMVNQVVPDGQELEAALDYARILAKSAPMVLHMLKNAVHETVIPKGPAEQAALTRRELMAVANSDDLQEGIASFKEKRSPEFTGR